MAVEQAEMSDMHELPGWVTTGIITIIGVLGTTVAFMFRFLMTQHAKELETTQKNHGVILDKLQEDVVECRADRTALREENQQIQIRLGILEDKQRRTIDQSGKVIKQAENGEIG
jgi:hypothetical protein